jgi:hypothetical protein
MRAQTIDPKDAAGRVLYSAIVRSNGRKFFGRGHLLSAIHFVQNPLLIRRTELAPARLETTSGSGELVTKGTANFHSFTMILPAACSVIMAKTVVSSMLARRDLALRMMAGRDLLREALELLAAEQRTFDRLAFNQSCVLLRHKSLTAIGFQT